MALPNASGKGNWSITEINANFKPTFEGRSKTMYSTLDVLEGRIKKRYNFTGKQKNIETQLSFAGGYGARLLPKANNSKMENQQITAQKVYARALVDREGLKAASNSQGAYERYLKFPISKCVENYTNQCGRITFGDATGILGRGDGATAPTGTGAENDPFIIKILAASWDESVWEEKAFVQYVSGLAAYPANTGGSMEGGDALTNILEVVEVIAPASAGLAGTVKLIGVSSALATLVSGPTAIPATSGFCMQRSYNGEPMGFENVLMATSGSLYGITVQRRWKAGQLDAGGAGILTDHINQVFLERKHIFGEEPDMIVCRYNQYQKLHTY